MGIEKIWRSDPRFAVVEPDYPVPQCLTFRPPIFAASSREKPSKMVAHSRAFGACPTAGDYLFLRLSILRANQICRRWFIRKPAHPKDPLIVPIRRSNLRPLLLPGALIGSPCHLLRQAVRPHSNSALHGASKYRPRLQRVKFQIHTGLYSLLYQHGHHSPFWMHGNSMHGNVRILSGNEWRFPDRAHTSVVLCNSMTSRKDC